MRLLSRSFLLLSLPLAVLAQFPSLTMPPSGNNQKATVIQYIGPVQVSIDYSSPAVHGPDGKDRHGQIWGKLVPYGLSTSPFGNQKPNPWRAGANENTVFAVSHDVLVEGQRLPAGRYGLHMIPGPEEWVVIFSKDAGAWGSFYYEPSHDALRVTVKPKSHPYREWLTYEFTERKPSQATAELQWEELSIPWRIAVENVTAIYMARVRTEITGAFGGTSEAYLAASQFCVANNIELEQGLEWAEAAISQPFVGKLNFETLSNKAVVLSKLNRAAEARHVMDKALRLPGTTALQIHFYGRQLMQAGKVDEAVEVYEYNLQRNGDVWPVHVGLARAYSAKKDYPKALEHARKALAQAPDELNRKSLQAMVEALSAGRGIE